MADIARTSWSNILQIGVDNFFEFPLNVRVTILIIPIGFMFIIISLVTNSWSESDSERIGLWSQCSTSNSFECCDSIVNFLKGESPGWIKATGGFHIMAVFSVILCGVVAVLTMCVSKYKNNTKINKYVWISYLLTAFMLMLSVSIYGSNYHNEAWLKVHRLSSSFVVAVIAFVLFLCGGLGLLILSHQAENTVQAISITDNDEPRPNSATPAYFTWLANQPIKTPNYWKIYNNSKRISEWHPHKAEMHLVPVQGNERSAIENLVQNTWRKDLVGVGRDAVGLQQLGYNRITVTNVERVENPKLFLKYAQERETLFRHVGTRGGDFPALEITANVLKGKVLTDAHINRMVLSDIYPAVNEHYLFHGTPVQYVDAIIRQGLDARLNKRGMFGPAVYAAESSTKSDSYADPQQERDIDSEKKMIVLRMLLGEIFVINEQRKFKRPPCKQCKNESCADKSHDTGNGSWYYDSVVVDGKWLFREFLVFEMNKCYPEYVVTYRRVWED